MTRRPTQDDLTQRVDELQARLAAIEQTQASGASGDPERTTRRDMFRRAGITAAGVVGGAAGLSLLNAQTVHAANGNPVILGSYNYETSETFISNTGSGSGSGLGAYGSGLGVGGYAANGGSGDLSSVGVFGRANAAGVSGEGQTYGVRGHGGLAGLHGQSTGSGGVVGLGSNTGVYGLGTGSAGNTGRGVAGSGITGVFGNAGSGGQGVKGLATGASGTGVVGSGSSGVNAGVVGKAYYGVIGSGNVATGTGSGTGSGYSPDLFAAYSGRLVQRYVSTAGHVPNFPSMSNMVGEQTRTPDGLLWLSDGGGNWLPATFGGWGISLFSANITTQPTLTNSDGQTWMAIDPSLTLTIKPTFNCDAILKLTGAPWSSTSGFNQDIGIAVTSSAYPAAGSPADPTSWTESGGFNTYAPTGATTEALVGLTAGTTYYITAVWKSNKSGTSKLYMGAGPLVGSGAFSPTRLTAHLLTDSAAGAGAVTKNQPAPKRTARKSKIDSKIKVGKARAATPAKRSAPKKAAARRAKLSTKPAPRATRTKKG